MPPSPRELTAKVKARLGDFASTELGTSNGCQDHTVLPYAAIPPSLTLRRDKPPKTIRKDEINVVRPRAAFIAHKPISSPCDRLRADAAASTASQPALVTTYDRPYRGWDEQHIRQFRISEKQNIFAAGA